MALEVFVPERLSRGRPLLCQQVSLDRSGNLRIRGMTALAAGIQDRATVLLDVGTMQVGLRKPKAGEKGLPLVVEPSKTGPRDARFRMNFRPALAKLRLNPLVCVGHYRTHQENGVILFNLCEPLPAMEDEPLAEPAAVAGSMRRSAPAEE